MKTIYLIVLSILFVNCGSSKNIDATTNADLNTWLEAREYQIEAAYAMPMNTAAVNAVLNSNILGPGNNSSQVSLIGNPNFVKIDGDSIHAMLPYFGERRMGGAYNSRDAGILVNGLIRDYEQEIKKGMYVITFSARDTEGTESYDFILNLRSNLVADLSIQSSQRTTIHYRGTVDQLKPEESKK